MSRTSKAIFADQSRARLERGRLLTCAQAGDALGLKEATIRVWIARRKLAFVKLGRAVRVPSEAIDALIADNTVPAREIRASR